MASPGGGSEWPALGGSRGDKAPREGHRRGKDLPSGFTAHCKEETEKSLRGRVRPNGPDVRGDRQSSGSGPRCPAREKA